MIMLSARDWIEGLIDAVLSSILNRQCTLAFLIGMRIEETMEFSISRSFLYTKIVWYLAVTLNENQRWSQVDTAQQVANQGQVNFWQWKLQ